MPKVLSWSVTCHGQWQESITCHLIVTIMDRDGGYSFNSAQTKKWLMVLNGAPEHVTAYVNYTQPGGPIHEYN